MSEVQQVQVKREGYAWSGETSGYQFAIFDRQQVEAMLGPADQLDGKQLAQELTEWSAFDRGVGRSFGETPRVKLYRHAILVTQFTALDI